MLNLRTNPNNKNVSARSMLLIDPDYLGDSSLSYVQAPETAWLNFEKMLDSAPLSLQTMLRGSHRSAASKFARHAVFFNTVAY